VLGPGRNPRPDVIVCLNEARDVRSDRVACPTESGRSVDVRSCATCRLLTWWPDDRVSQLECSAEAGGGRHPAGIVRRPNEEI